MHDVLPATSLRADQAVGVCAFRGGFTAATIRAVEQQSNHLGGRWATVTLELPDGELVPGVDTRGHVFITPERTEMAWCPECRTQREVLEASDESAYEGAWEVEFWVTRLECGHETQGPGKRVGPSPGGESAREAIVQRETQDRLDREAVAVERFGL